MLIKIPKGWEIPEQLVTPEDVFINRRTFLAGSGSIAVAGALPDVAFAAAKDADPTADLYPAKRNPKYKIPLQLTPESVNSRYNNFYEFGSHKKIHEAAQALPIRPWEVTIDGDVEKPFKIGIDELIRKMTLEERLYRHRCVEAWSMTIPWSGFAMKDLVEMAKPLAKAKYVRMETFKNPEVARGQRASWYPWPYVEGLTIAEATNELTFMVTGAYGKPMAKQFGAPLRLAVPWKYGFKHIKSIVRFTFTDKRPKSFWEVVQGKEYGFWANVNPQVDHPRWSQATERVLGTSIRVPTLKYNGYGEFVADMYTGMEDKRTTWM
ncbi:MAG: protein-methionine-sulfoxide reductase catalytic subunit MsrP [Hyphomicrobiaceae bacterium]|nr:protein-methionine-sulfoxide reductase catalytic subunit MsrP [Hyphomicrobiaceae bacterium]